MTWCGRGINPECFAFLRVKSLQSLHSDLHIGRGRGALSTGTFLAARIESEQTGQLSVCSWEEATNRSG